MWIGIVSLFPEMFAAVSDYGVTGRALDKGLLALEVWNPRDFTQDKRQTVDDKPYGGGPGMLMKVAPLKAAIEAAQRQAASVAGSACQVVCLSPQGQRLDQALLNRLAQAKGLILVAGRYEGIDERIINSLVDEEVSIGDYVVSGGELPAMVLIDGLSRLLPGVVGDAESVAGDSFMDGLLDFPQYTRPEEIDGLQVPEVLLSGDHAAIASWRRMQSLGRTRDRRPDIFAQLELSEDDKQLLARYQSECQPVRQPKDKKESTT
ncbi:MAG: tRNA (guanosine(37)-N1)-methyltransferase TrmD [Pseudomonadales bacterium]